MKTILIATAVLFTSALYPSSQVRASEVNEVAACAGMIIGDAAITYDLDGNSDSLELALEVAYAGYFGYVFGTMPDQQDILQADSIMQKNIELIFTKYENGAYTNETYEDVIRCYQSNSVQLIAHGEKIRDNGSTILQFVGNAKTGLMALLP